MDGFVHAWIWIQLEAMSIVIILILPVLPLLVTAILSYFVACLLIAARVTSFAVACCVNHRHFVHCSDTFHSMSSAQNRQ